MFIQNNRSDHDLGSNVGDEELNKTVMESNDNSSDNDDQTDEERKKQEDGQANTNQARQHQTVNS